MQEEHNYLISVCKHTSIAEIQSTYSEFQNIYNSQITGTIAVDLLIDALRKLLTLIRVCVHTHTHTHTHTVFRCGYSIVSKNTQWRDGGVMGCPLSIMRNKLCRLASLAIGEHL